MHPPRLEVLIGGEEVVNVLLGHVAQVLKGPVRQAEVDPVLARGRVARCQHTAKFGPFLSFDCAVLGNRGAIQGKEGIKFCSVA